jgi:hypothetical protein
MKKTAITVSAHCHQRIKIGAAKQGIKIQDFVLAVFDYTLPLLESGKLAIAPQKVAQVAPETERGAE